VSDFTKRRRAQLAADPDLGPSDLAPSWLVPTDLSGSAVTPAWLTAVSCHAGALSPDGRRLAYISDREGLPTLWLTTMPSQPDTDPDSDPNLETPAETPAVDAAGVEDAAIRLETGPGHARTVSWSPDGEWLACQLAPCGGEHTRVVVLRPDGTRLRELAGGAGVSADAGSWRMDAGAIGITVADQASGDVTAYVVDPVTGERTALMSGPAAQVCSFSPDGHFAVVRVGRRGDRQLMVVHVGTGRATPVLPRIGAHKGATVADARFSVDGSRMYVHTDAGRARPALISLPWDRGGPRRDDYARHAVIAARRDADLDAFAVCGTTLAAVWNVDGRSELELIEPDREPGGPVHQPLRPPADVVRSVSFAGDRSWLLVRAEGPTQPPYLARYRLRDADPTPCPVLPTRSHHEFADLVTPTLLRFDAEDGLALSGWWYEPARPAGTATAGPAPAVLWLHGGPEAQERPTFAPLLQGLAAAGIGVFAPNVRGSSGYGRKFVNADNHERRWSAIHDVAAAARFLVEGGYADPARLGCTGRSYGGYLTLAALVAYPELFAAGVDVCGMSDLETFFAHTEPWIAAAATSKYGDPARDRELLRELSPLHRIERLVAPLLVVHGEYDTNVPLIEARQVVDALQRRGLHPGLLVFPDEGHEIHGVANRAVFVHAVVRWLSSHLLDSPGQRLVTSG
jgi:dipeptidyl aminopeptidase/acylaminoacyl peptidase